MKRFPILICLCLFSVVTYSQQKNNLAVGIYTGSFKYGTSHEGDKILTIKNKLGTLVGLEIMYNPIDRLGVYGSAEVQQNKIKGIIKDDEGSVDLNLGLPISINTGFNYDFWSYQEKLITYAGLGYSYVADFKYRSTGFGDLSEFGDYPEYISIVMHSISDHGLLYFRFGIDYILNNRFNLFLSLRQSTELHSSFYTEIVSSYKKNAHSEEQSEKIILNHWNTYLDLGIRFYVF